jgi:hypothetical protein
MTGEPRVRRRVEEPGPDTTGRTGCIAVGAVLGIVAGALFTFFGLPPILHHFLGETHIGVGETYEGDASYPRDRRGHRSLRRGQVSSPGWRNAR